MQVSQTGRIEIPNALREQLLAYRRRVWTVKLIEALAATVIGVLLGFLAIYSLDRVGDTPWLVRLAILSAALVGCLAIPIALERWVWRHRRIDQLARLLTKTYPSVGDQLLGVIELSESESEQTRSRQLVEAAIGQVAADVQRRELGDAIPRPRHRQRTWIAATLGFGTLLLCVFTAAAATNTWARFLMPWKTTPRYTFADVSPLPASFVVPHGEPFRFDVQLNDDSAWRPDLAQASLQGRSVAAATREQDGYHFDLPGQISPTALQVDVGDFSGETELAPMIRPELQSLEAVIRLPDYLQRTAPLKHQLRGSSLTAVEGSEVTIAATASRPLAAATANGELRPTNEHSFATEPISIAANQSLTLGWRDRHGLSGKDELELTIEAVADQPPTLACEAFPRRKVVLDSEVLTFTVHTADDFGVRRVGYQWRGLDPQVSDPAEGERIIGAGSPESERLELGGTFAATELGIDPQPISLRVFVDDYLPGRERVYGPEAVLYVLTAEQHAVWIADQMSRWQRMSLDVRDTELQLHETNKQLRGMSAAELDTAESRQQLTTQAGRERANARRLSELVRAGDELLAEAMRNPEIGVGHLDRWAEMMQILKDISGNRMPSVADLIKQAAQSKPGEAASPANEKSAKFAGQNRAEQQPGNGNNSPADEPPPPAAPSLVDVESTHQSSQPGEPKPPTESKPKSNRLTLPTTMLAGNGSADAEPEQEQTGSPSQPLDQAIAEQQDLLAEFDKVVDELNELLANLEGSTLVKRLKAASRQQQHVATELTSVVPTSFGVQTIKSNSDQETMTELADLERAESEKTSYIIDDLAAYFSRSRYMRFKAVLDDMREQDVPTELQQLGNDLSKENGLSIAQAEYWGETFDRWAEDLVEVTKSGACPGCKAKGSLPPSIVLEVLQVLEGEVKLREQTREAEQALPAVSADEHRLTSARLSESQSGFRARIDDVVKRIAALPDAETDFGKELKQLGQVSLVMDEAAGILAGGQTGSLAIAAETEAIELLLESKRFNPNGGGGGGANPGGGGGGDTQVEALALVGAGFNVDEVQPELTATHASGTTSQTLPEEFRRGLNAYFNEIERWKRQ